MKRVITIIFALIIIQACTKDNSHKEGLLSFDIAGASDVMVQTMPGNAATKATLPNADYGIFTINAGTGINGDTTSIVESRSLSSIKDETFVVGEGSYVASAYNCTELEAHPSDGFGQVRYYGKTSFSVVPGNLTAVEIPCSVANAMVTISLDNSFLKAFKAESTTVTLSTNAGRTDRALEFTTANGHLLTPENADGAGVANSAFYPGGTNLYITISSQLYSLGGDVEVKNYTYSGTATSDGATVTTALGCWHKIKICADLSNAPSGITVRVNQEQVTIPDAVSISGYNSGSLSEDK